MNEIVNITQGTALTMSSLEVAGLTGKMHKHVLRDIRKMLVELGEQPAQIWARYTDAKGEAREVANLPKRETMILVSGYSTELRARIVDRWMELEGVVASATSNAGLVTDLAAEVRNAIGGIVKGIVHKEMTETIPALVAAKLAEQNLSVTDGVTAGEVCGLSKVATNYPKGIARRVSVRLSLFCARNGEKPRVSRLGRVRAQVFPTHLVREWLDIEGRGLIKSWVAESLGQKHLRLVGGNGGVSGEAQARGQA